MSRELLEKMSSSFALQVAWISVGGAGCQPQTFFSQTVQLDQSDNADRLLNDSSGLECESVSAFLPSFDGSASDEYRSTRSSFVTSRHELG